MSAEKDPYNAIERIICDKCGTEMKATKDYTDSRKYSCEFCSNAVIIHMEE